MKQDIPNTPQPWPRGSTMLLSENIFADYFSDSREG